MGGFPVSRKSCKMDSSTVAIALGAPVLALFLLHYKSLPLAYTLRSYFLLRSIIPKAKWNLQSPLDLFTVVNQHERCLWDDIDYNSHMNNSSYNKVLDFSRIRLLYLLLPQVMLDQDASIYCNNAGVLTLFKKEIVPLQRYTIQTRILTWDEKWFWLEHRFVYPKELARRQQNQSLGDDDSVTPKELKAPDDEIVVACIALSKLVFKERSGKTVPPTTVLEICGHGVGNEEREERRARAYAYLEGLANTEKLFDGRWGVSGKRSSVTASLTRAKL
ncbi:hypothetical protein BC937DRAFT_89449 [Endogone sp. FLAS-F59071]|nr:hypothetical protein BC937DRAFT_89449 [Endogone sp. FLAS-F59071]|eukprot:RUS22401.1 hypothetical protein BC937DRAFT_89449 [Endogone sp. FLAS-F59071]